MEPRLYVSESNAALFRCSLQRNTVHGQTPVLEKTSCINNVPLYMIYVPISTQLKLEAIKQFFSCTLRHYFAAYGIHIHVKFQNETCAR